MHLKEKLYYKKTEFFSELYDKFLYKSIRSHSKICGRPLFILGSGRNGSTLIASLLNNHSKIFIPPENSIIPFAIKYWLLHPLKTNQEKLKRLFEELEKPSMWRVNLTAIKSELETISDSHLTDVLNKIYLYYGANYKSQQEFIWGDKTPSNTIYAYSIKKQFPNCKMLFLLRDPRAVISSLLEANYHYYIHRVDHFIWRWKISLRKYEILLKKYPDSVLLLKYEELVSEPKPNMQKLTRWLGLEYENLLIESPKNNMTLLGVSAAKHHQNLIQDVTPIYISKWKTKLNKEKAVYIKRKLYIDMNKYGYE